MIRFFPIFLLSCCFLYKSYGQNPFYNINKIQKIEIFFQETSWDYKLDTAKMGKDSYVMAKQVKINGVSFDSVGIKYKGNSSYDSTFKKNPVHIELDSYKEQDYFGVKDIKLSNGYADPSMIREVLAYSILGNYMNCPLSNFAQVYINSTYMGVYSNSESINKTFCANHFYTNTGTFVKGNPKLTPSPNVKSNLKHLGGDSSNYFNYYEMKSDYGWKNLEALCDTLTNNPNGTSSILNVDAALWMLAFNTLLINLDSYNGAFAQNYYLYKDANGHFNPIIWDLNMSFGGFPFLGNSNSSLGSLSISAMQNLSSSIHSTDQYWPLIKIVHNNASYKKRYIAHLRTITEEFFANNTYVTTYNSLKNLVDTAVLSDTRKFYSYADFQNALTANVSVGSYSVPGIQTLMSSRLSYLQATTEFTAIAPAISGISNTSPDQNKFVSVSGTVVGATSLLLYYRFSTAKPFTSVTMFDDGQHNDGQANDNVFSGGFTLAGNHAQYYIYAENANAGMFSPQRAAQEYHSINILTHPLPGQVSINEFLANNKSDVANEFHITEDWIELYNNTSNALSLEDYYLGDNLNEKARYVFPKGTTIQPHEYLIVWADEFLNGTQLHSGFKLNEDGDQIVLSDGLTKILDYYAFGEQEKDVSMARCPDGTGPFGFSNFPSFKLSNCIVGISENTFEKNNLLVYPNPAGSSFSVKNTSGAEEKLKIISSLGQIIYETNIQEELTIESGSWKNGLYFLSCGKQTKKLIITN